MMVGQVTLRGVRLPKGIFHRQAMAWSGFNALFADSEAKE